MIPYIISTPNYDKAKDWVVSLHNLSKLINENGHKAYVNAKISIKGSPSIFGKKEELRKMIIDGAICVYSECVMNNYLWSKNPVGWLFSKGDFLFVKEGLLFTSDKKYSDAPELIVNDKDKNINNRSVVQFIQLTQDWATTRMK